MVRSTTSPRVSAGMLPTGIPASRLATRSMLPTGIEPTGIEPTGIEPTGIEPTGIEPTGTPAIDRPTTVFVPLTPEQVPPAAVIAAHHEDAPPGAGSWASVARPSMNAENGTPFRIEFISPLSGRLSALNLARVVAFA